MFYSTTKSSLLFLNITKFLTKNSSRGLSSTRDTPGRVVFISQSTDVYSNLAIENWLYRNWNFSKRHLLLLWRNSPSVVIGRHQNPFTEANLDYLESANVPVVRRHSGGGTVYHDDGNLNCTFFTSKNSHNRKENLNLLCNVLQNKFNIPAQINKKDDIVVEKGLKFQISGSAAKLGRLTAYHHCTLLVSADKLQLKLALKGDKSLKSKATESIPSPVVNLQEFCSDLTVEKLLGNVGRAYLDAVETTELADGFTLINPSEEWFPGLDDLKAELRSWKWFYGMTPNFKQTRPVNIHSSFSEGSSVLVTVEVYHGIIQNVAVSSTVVGRALRDLVENDVASALKGSRYATDVFLEVEARLADKVEAIKGCSSL